MRIALVVSSVVLLSGCYLPNTKPQDTLQSQDEVIHIDENRNLAEDSLRNFNFTAEYRVKEMLYQQFREWEGTPYLYGGSTKRGIDCSALVQRIFASAFELNVPRSTYYQVKIGEKVDRKKLEVLDLVFFKLETGRHVGIYLGDGKFIHASTSMGVIISTLENPYWSRNYWTARRPAPNKMNIAGRS